MPQPPCWQNVTAMGPHHGSATRPSRTRALASSAASRPVGREGGVRGRTAPGRRQLEVVPVVVRQRVQGRRGVGRRDRVGPAALVRPGRAEVRRRREGCWRRDGKEGAREGERRVGHPGEIRLGSIGRRERVREARGRREGQRRTCGSRRLGRCERRRGQQGQQEEQEERARLGHRWTGGACWRGRAAWEARRVRVGERAARRGGWSLGRTASWRSRMRRTTRGGERQRRG